MAGPGVGWTFELNLGEGQNLKWRQEQERQEQESRQNKELREKNTEKSVREQKKTGLMQRVRGDSSLGWGGLRPQKRREGKARH